MQGWGGMSKFKVSFGLGNGCVIFIALFVFAPPLVVLRWSKPHSEAVKYYWMRMS